jgi:hypothetical protein
MTSSCRHLYPRGAVPVLRLLGCQRWLLYRGIIGFVGGRVLPKLLSVRFVERISVSVGDWPVEVVRVRLIRGHWSV